ncbi:MAG: Fis family transcriptional regulator, partial [Bdellovibrio sp.]
MKILIADDESSVRQSIRLILSSEPYEILESGDLKEISQLICNENPDAVLLDIHFKGQGTSLDLMPELARQFIPTIILSGAATAGEAAAAIKLGAYDYIEKPVSADRLKLTLRRCLENSKLQQQWHDLTARQGAGVQLTGRSAAVLQLRRLIEQYGKKDVRVLITGETGVGKDVVAQLLWKSSNRADKAFIIVNSAALPENLLESELFGHKKGSFTGATTDQIGKIEMADRGTLFLDEIGDLSPSAQTKLLRFLEAGEIQKVGSHQIRKVDVRLIAATSRNLEADIERGLFRTDLYYRLNVARIHVPPLRDRSEDIASLFSYFVVQFCRKFKEPEKRIEPGVVDLLCEYSWPGNIRELRNAAERAVLYPGPTILAAQIAEILPQQRSQGSPPGLSDSMAPSTR